MSEHDGAGRDEHGAADDDNVWAEATARKPDEEASGGRASSFDPSRFVDSLDGMFNDFFRGASIGKAAVGFGRAAGRTARGASGRGRDVWADATSERGPRDASAECRYCPFCQTLAAVRGARPELTEQISDTARRLLDLVRQAAEQTTGGRGRSR